MLPSGLERCGGPPQPRPAPGPGQPRSEAAMIFRKRMSCSRVVVRRVLEKSENHQLQLNVREHDHHSLFRRMRLRRDPLRIDRGTGHDASLPLPGLPASQRGAVFGFRDRADGSVQALAGRTALPCLSQRDGRHDAAGLLRRLWLADGYQARRGPSICCDPVRKLGRPGLVQAADGGVDLRRAPVGSIVFRAATV